MSGYVAENGNITYGHAGECDVKVIVSYPSNSGGGAYSLAPITKHVTIAKPEITKVVGTGAATPYATQAPPANSTTSTSNLPPPHRTA